MENILLYFFSTIPQVLSALLAFVFIFVMFKMSEFEKVIDIYCSNFAEVLGNGPNWQKLSEGSKFMSNYKSKYYKGISKIMLENYDAKKDKHKDSSFAHLLPEMKRIIEKTQRIEGKRGKLVFFSKLLCGIGLCTILSCISIFPFLKCIIVNYNLMIFLFVLFIILVSTIFVIIYNIVSQSLNIEKSEV